MIQNRDEKYVIPINLNEKCSLEYLNCITNTLKYYYNHFYKYSISYFKVYGQDIKINLNSSDKQVTKMKNVMVQSIEKITVGTTLKSLSIQPLVLTRSQATALSKFWFTCPKATYCNYDRQSQLLTAVQEREFENIISNNQYVDIVDASWQ